MKTSYMVVGLIVFVAIIAVVYVLSQPRGATPFTTGALGTGAASSTFAGIWGGLGQVGTSIAGAAES